MLAVPVALYLLAANVILFSLMRLDRYSSLTGQPGIPKGVLIGLALLGGSIGGTIAMYRFHHKPKALPVLFPLLMAAQILAVVMLVLCHGVGV